MELVDPNDTMLSGDDFLNEPSLTLETSKIETYQIPPSATVSPDTGEAWTRDSYEAWKTKRRNYGKSLSGMALHSVTYDEITK